jgi:hypothetical protein
MREEVKKRRPPPSVPLEVEFEVKKYIDCSYSRGIREKKLSLTRTK